MPPKGKTPAAAAPAAKAAAKPAAAAAPAAAKKGAAAPAAASAKKGAAAPAKKGAAPAKVDPKANPLIEKRTRNFGIGGNIQPKRDLGRFVKWPKYIRLQRQKTILYQRLKIPPAINQFTKAIEKNTATELFRLLSKYRPETHADKKARLLEEGTAKAAGKEKDPAKKPYAIKYGLNHVTALIEAKKAQLVVIAHDVDPIELVIWLPALCRKHGIPYCIVRGKARLGTLVHKKTAAVLAVKDVRTEDKAKLAQLTENIKSNFNDKYDEYRRRWGGGINGHKSLARVAKLEKAKAKELAAKMG